VGVGSQDAETAATSGSAGAIGGSARAEVSETAGATGPARTEIAEAGRVLSALGLVTAFGHVSARAGAQLIITPAADLADVGPADLVEVDLAATSLPPGAPAEAWAHLQVYAARPDVRAIARAQPPAAFAVGALASELPLLHGQACWLGRTVPVHEDARLLRSRGLADAAARSLGESDALLLRGNGGLACGATPGQAVARMWLLAAACEVWLAAAAAGTPLAMDAAAMQSWRAVQGELLPRLWRHLRHAALPDGGRPCDD
jgi:HCOMODA/2-hydroxy-3-carboxy-muconic semialdehyde decarboxylase